MSALITCNIFSAKLNEVQDKEKQKNMEEEAYKRGLVHYPLSQDKIIFNESS